MSRLAVLPLLPLLALSLASAEPHRFSTLFTAQDVRDGLGTGEGIAQAIDWCRKTSISKVYIESFRSGYRAERAALLNAKERFAAAGFEVSGCVTTTKPGKISTGWNLLSCYTDRATQENVRSIFEYTASLFDEIMIDDFWFTDCTCEDCERARAGRSWEDYRSDLFLRLSRENVIGAARRVNPKVRLILKYPEWYDRFHERGYDVARQTPEFDRIWVGTETRDRDQKGALPYQAYFIMRWLAGAGGEKTGGGWYDGLRTTPATYIEQARQTVLAGARESMLFSYGTLQRNHGPADVAELRRHIPELRKVAAEVAGRKPAGIAAYKPLNSHPEKEPFIFNRVGMMGLPLVPCHEFPADAPAAFFSIHALKDPQFKTRLAAFVKAGKPVLLSEGLAAVIKPDALNVRVLTAKPDLDELRAFMKIDFRAPDDVGLYLFTDGSWAVENFRSDPARVALNGRAIALPARGWKYEWAPPDPKQQVMKSLERMARAITDRAAEEIRTRESWEKVRARRTEEMRDMLGLLPWPKRTPLNVRITGKIDKGDYVIEKIAFESLPRFYVTGNLYLPKNAKGRAPAVVYVCGHSNSPYGAKAQYQRHGISFAKNGYVCFILDPIQIAETWAAHHGVKWQEMLDWYSRGYTPAGPETWNAIRAIDYLETRTEVDKGRIGITGRSGGAAMSWFPAAIDPRIRIAAPIMGISTYAADVRENTQRLHCDCMFPINSWMHDMMHQGALIAPRPLIMGHGSKDALFPVAGYTEFEQRVRGLYSTYGAEDRFRNVVVPTAHADSDFLRETVLRWFDRFFLKQSERKLDMAYVNEEPAHLAVFPGGPPADAQNFRVHETFTTRPPSPLWASRAAWEKRRAALLAELRAKVFAAPADDLAPRMEVRAAPKGKSGLPGLIYIASEGEDGRSINELLNQVREGVRVVVYPRGTGEAPWDRTFYKDVLRNAMFVGHTVDSLRLGDVRAAIAKLRAEAGVDPARIMVMGRGVSGAIGLYAAILDPAIAQVMLVDPPESHATGPIFLNVLRYTDLPEAAALLAPRPLNFYARMPAAYEYTRHVYKLYGKNLFRGMSIQGVLNGRYDHNFGSGI